MTTAGTTRDSEHPARPPRSRHWLLPAGLALVTAGLLGGLLLGKGMASPGVERVTDPVSIGFVRDMGLHHAQAVRMSEIVHRRSSDPKINYLAFDILSTQQGQIGIMSGWLELWRQTPGGPDEPMAWMGHSGPMPGMASDAEVEELNTLPVRQMEERFLRLMVRHHRGAVPMADVAANHAKSTEVALFADKMSDGQQSEIDLMQSMLGQRGLALEPEASAGGHGTGAPSYAAPRPSASHSGH